MAFSCLSGEVAVFAEYPLYHDAQLRSDVLLDRPVDADVPPDRPHEFPGDGLDSFSTAKGHFRRLMRPKWLK